MFGKHIEYSFVKQRAGIKAWYSIVSNFFFNRMTVQIYQFRLYIVARFTIVQIKWCSASSKSHLTNFKTLNSILKFGSQRRDVS